MKYPLSLKIRNYVLLSRTVAKHKYTAAKKMQNFKARPCPVSKILPEVTYATFVRLQSKQT